MVFPDQSKLDLAMPWAPCSDLFFQGYYLTRPTKFSVPDLYLYTEGAVQNSASLMAIGGLLVQYSSMDKGPGQTLFWASICLLFCFVLSYCRNA